MAHAEFYIDTTLERKFIIPTSPEADPECEIEEVDVRIWCLGTFWAGRHARIRFDEFDHPAEEPEIEIMFDRVEVLEKMKLENGGCRWIPRPIQKTEDWLIPIAEEYMDLHEADFQDALIQELLE